MKICTEIVVPVTLEVKKGNEAKVLASAVNRARVALQEYLKWKRLPPTKEHGDFSKFYGDGTQIKFLFGKPIARAGASQI